MTKKEVTQFTCGHCCARVIFPRDTIAHNHCPECMWSKHIGFGSDCGYPEIAKGCGGLMEPVRVFEHPRWGRSVLHKCHGCGLKMIGPADRLAENFELSFPSLGLSFVR
jgi:hypothetical protein